MIKKIVVEIEKDKFHTLSIVGDDPDKVISQFCTQAKNSVDKLTSILFFCNDQFDQPKLAQQLKQNFVDIQVVGGVASGLIGQNGYVSNEPGTYGIVAVLFSGLYANVEAHLFSDLSDYEINSGYKTAGIIKKRIVGDRYGKKKPRFGWPVLQYKHHFGVLLVCSPNKEDEIIIDSIQVGLGSIPLLGATFEPTGSMSSLYYDGQFHNNVALLCVFSVTDPIVCFSTHGFTPDRNIDFVITKVDMDKRLIFELDGIPATDALALKLGQPIDHFKGALHNLIFCNSFGRLFFPKTIKSIKSDKSLEMHCTLEEGSILNIGVHNGEEDMFERLSSDIEKRLGHHYKIFGFESIYRRKSAEVSAEEIKVVNKRFSKIGLIGCNTTTEHVRGAVRNSSLTCVALSYRDAGSLGEIGDE